MRIAVAYYALALGAWLMRRAELARWAWSLGLVFFLAHVFAAFQAVHGWSHSAALAETARQTRALTGFDSGSGLWLNYLFALLWTTDVAALWFARRWRETRPRWLSWTLHGFMAFMVVNGAIVFAPGATRFVSLILFAGLLLLAGIRFRRRQPGSGYSSW